MGPMTGRGAGYCAGYGLPGYANSAAGRGRGRGYRRGACAGRGFGSGRGLGRGAPFGQTGAAGSVPAGVEKWNLERRAEALEEKLKSIRSRLGALEIVNEPSSESK